MTVIDPVNLDPIPPLHDSYVHHSPLPPSADKGSDANKEGWMMGIDEAGRGRELLP
jgi:ribonuclease H2 subunit A